MTRKYMDFTLFREKYLRTSLKENTSGSYGVVYESEEYVIKRQVCTKFFFRECSFLSQIDHPNIIKMINFSINEEYSFMAIEKGVPLIEAYLNGEITLKDIIHGIFSAFLFLYKYGIAHCDLKPTNCVVIDGKLKLIDFGFARSCVLHNNQYYFKELAYSDGFRHPEYDEKDFNPIKVECYSIAKTIEYFINLHDEEISEELQKVLDECKKDLDISKNILDIVLLPYFENISILDFEIKFPSNSQEYNKEILLQTFSDICYMKNFKDSRSIFLALEIARMSHSCIQDYTNVFAKLCCYIACSIYDTKSVNIFYSIVGFSDPSMINLAPEGFNLMKQYNTNAIKIISEIMRITDGRLFLLTQFDFCFYEDEYIFLICKMFHENYNISKIINNYENYPDTKNKGLIFHPKINSGDFERILYEDNSDIDFFNNKKLELVLGVEELDFFRGEFS